MGKIIKKSDFGVYERQHLKTKMIQGHQELTIISKEQLIKMAHDFVSSKVKPVAGHVSSAMDVHTAVKVMQDTGGFFGKVHFKGNYVIFKKVGGRGQILRGTRYLRENPKIVRLGIGRSGLKNMVHQGAIVTLVLFVAIDVALAILSDKPFVTSLLGNLCSDALGVALGRFAGMIATRIVTGIVGEQILGATLIGVAGAPAIFVVVGAGILAGVLYGEIEKRNGITNLVIDYIEKADKNFSENFIEPAKRTFSADRLELGNLLMNYFRFQ